MEPRDVLIGVSSNLSSWSQADCVARFYARFLANTTRRTARQAVRLFAEHDDPGWGDEETCAMQGNTLTNPYGLFTMKQLLTGRGSAW